MSDETKDDVTSTSSVEQPVNDQVVEETTTENTGSQETTEQPQEEGQETTPTAEEQKTSTPINADLYDERGVPWKNVALEHRRKYEETQANLPQRIAEEVARLSQPQEKKYSIGELEKFAQENPEHRPWAEEEKAKVLKESISKEWEAKSQAQNKAQQDEFVRKDTFTTVTTQFPDMVIKDQQGRFMSWNNSNPMTQAVSKYMASPDLSGRPDGLMIASKLAYADLAFQKTPQTAKTIKTMQSKLRKAQAQTFVEGGGKRPQAVNPNAKAHARLKETGSRDDGAAIMRNVLKAQGMIKE